MNPLITSALLLLGATFVLLASIGIVRMPDLYCRMHAATKAGTFGLATMLLALVLSYPNPRCIVQSGLILIFYYLTAPVAAQMIGRVGVRREIFFYKGRSFTDTSNSSQNNE